MLATGVCFEGYTVLTGLGVLFIVAMFRVAGLCTSDLARLGRPFMLTCMVCLIGVMWSDDLARLGIPMKQEVIYGCLEARRGCSGVGPMDRSASVFTSKPCHQLAMRVERRSGLESVRVSKSKCLGVSA
jgi:hypothetical protein